MKVGPVRDYSWVIEEILEPDYNQFCMKEIVESLIEEKTRLTDVPHEQLTAARGKSNPYEKVGDSIFMNRAAMKLACLDAQVGLTGIKRYDPVKDLTYAVDQEGSQNICCGGKIRWENEFLDGGSHWLENKITISKDFILMLWSNVVLSEFT
ncbi:12512_t:CDS:2, partial [Acaulospora colombiana]